MEKGQSLRQGGNGVEGPGERQRGRPSIVPDNGGFVLPEGGWDPGAVLMQAGRPGAAELFSGK